MKRLSLVSTHKLNIFLPPKHWSLWHPHAGRAWERDAAQGQDHQEGHAGGEHSKAAGVA